MDLNELYKEIEKAEIDLNAKRLGDYIQLYTTTKKIIIGHFNIYFVYI